MGILLGLVVVAAVISVKLYAKASRVQQELVSTRDMLETQLRCLQLDHEAEVEKLTAEHEAAIKALDAENEKLDRENYRVDLENKLHMKYAHVCSECRRHDPQIRAEVERNLRAVTTKR